MKKLIIGIFTVLLLLPQWNIKTEASAEKLNNVKSFSDSDSPRLTVAQNVYGNKSVAGSVYNGKTTTQTQKVNSTVSESVYTNTTVTQSVYFNKVVQKYSHTIPVPHNDSRIVYEGEWETGYRDTAINGSHTFTDTTDAAATLDFTGDYIGVIMESGTYSGIAEIILDGVSQGNFDCYSPYTYYPFVYFTKKLYYGEHNIKIRVTGTKNEASKGAYIWLDHFFYNIDKYDITTPQQSGVILTFDDTRTSTYDYAVPKLQKYGFKATCYINPGYGMSKKITDESSLDIWKIYFLKVHDFEIASHGYDHVDLTTLSEDEIRTNLRKATEWLQNNGMDSGHFVAPYNSVNETVLKVIKEFHCSLATSGDTAFDRLNFDPYNIPRYDVQETTDINKLKAVLKSVKDNNQAIVLLFHGITEGTPEAPNISKVKFDEIIDYMSSIGLNGMRMKDFLPL